MDACTRNASDSKWAALCAWGEDYCGAKNLDRLFRGRFEKRGGKLVYGVGATRGFRVDEKVACLPKRCWMSSDLAPMAPKCGMFSVIIHIAEEMRRGAGSKYAAYLALLPTEEEYHRFHPFFSDHAIPKEHDPWTNPHWAWLRTLRKCWNRYLEDYPSSTVSWSDVEVAAVHMQTRHFFLGNYAHAGHAGEADAAAMLPIIDSLNTVPREELNVYEALDTTGQEHVFCLKASRDIAAGEELFVDYDFDDHSALFFFRVFGFTLGPGKHGKGRLKPGEKPGRGLPDMCQGLRPSDLAGKPGPSVDVYREFSRDFCSDDEPPPRPKSGSRGPRFRASAEEEL